MESIMLSRESIIQIPIQVEKFSSPKSRYKKNFIKLNKEAAKRVQVEPDLKTVDRQKTA